MERQVPVHWLRANHTEWTPPVLIAMDTETMPVDRDRDVQGLRCWVASRVDRPGGRTDIATRVDAWGTTAAELAATVDAWTRGRPTAWMYCHNLGFDLSVSRLPVELCRIGWQISDFAIDGRAPWMRLTKGRKHLTLSDSWSWLPKALQEISTAVGITKPPLPASDDALDTWVARCRADVDILLAAMSQLMDWWNDTGRGRWTITGAASGWNAYRHTPTPYKVLIDPDDKGRAFDREAIYGGKRFVARVGNLHPGGYAELDFARAYTVVAGSSYLPVRRCNEFASLALDDERLSTAGWGIIAQCTVSTRTPLYPKRDGGRVWYPVGTFHTTLAAPEIAYAAGRGDLLAIGRGFTYRTAPHMAPWAAWCLDIVDSDRPGVPEVARIAAKQWGRSVIGKWAARGYKRIKLGASITEGWSYEDTWMDREGSRGSIVDLGGSRFLSYADGDGENSFPAVLAFVESHVRVALNKAIQSIGSHAFIQCDTDGMLVSTSDLLAGARHMDIFAEAQREHTDPVAVMLARVSEVTAPLTLRVKSVYRRVEVVGPQHLKLDGKRRYSGIPSTADELGDGRLGAWTWPKLAWQMRHGDRRGFVREYQRYRVPRNLAVGWIIDDGRVVPVEYRIGDGGTDEPMSWPATRWHAMGLALGPDQNPDVVRLCGEGGK